MDEFMGIKNVIDAIAIVGKDGRADGFRIIYQEPRKIRIGNRVIEKMVEKECVKYIREYNFDDVGNDGTIHGFGRGTVYLRSSGKKRVSSMTAAGLASVARSIGR